VSEEEDEEEEEEEASLRDRFFLCVLRGNGETGRVVVRGGGLRERTRKREARRERPGRRGGRSGAVGGTHFLDFLSFFSFFAFFAIAKDPPRRADARRRVPARGMRKNDSCETASPSCSARRFLARFATGEAVPKIVKGGASRLAHRGLIDPRGRLKPISALARGIRTRTPARTPPTLKAAIMSCIAATAIAPVASVKASRCVPVPAPSSSSRACSENGTASSASDDAIKSNP
jgi:hypothetical protein